MRNLKDPLFALLTSDKKPRHIFYPLSQGNTKYCIYFAFASCLAWNTGIKMKEDKIVFLWDLLKAGKVHIKVPELALQLKRFYDCYKIDSFFPALDKWWGVIVYIKPTKEWWIDATDGTIDTESTQGDWLDHCVWIRKHEGRIQMINSWKNLPIIDITDKIGDMIQNWLIVWDGYVFTLK